jgi:pyrroline-5-carboxylate reductase
MGGAMLSRWLASGLDPARVTVIRPSGRVVADGVRVTTAPPEGEPPPAVLMLAFKPQKLDEAAPPLVGAAGLDTVLLSILAGVERVALARRFPAAGAIVRAMPNTPVAIGRGVVALSGGDVAAGVRTSVDALMAPLGLVEWLADERALDAATALAGSGPAFLFRFVDALARAGVADGLDFATAARLGLATVEGAAALAAGAAEAPAALADRVASPGGSTRAGLDVLDRDGALAALLAETLAAARRRNAEMAAAAR